MQNKIINTLRVISAEMVQEANSGHPGMPLGCAPMMYVLWLKIMNYNPQNPNWINRDRFILSNGHGCALLYSILHLVGFHIDLEDLKKFRQLDSITPGHPEKGVTPGVEVTTGPLGQGIANGVGMAIAEKYYSALTNNLVKHYVYVMCGDGCLMEGISQEAISLAGHLNLDNLIVLFDDNQITIDGSTDLSNSEDITKKFQAMGWHVLTIEDGNQDIEDIENKIKLAKQLGKPALIRVKTTIGFLSNKSGKAASHGAPLGQEEVNRLRQELLGSDKSFDIGIDVLDHCRFMIKRGLELEGDWNQKANNNPIIEQLSHPIDLNNFFDTYSTQDKAAATRSLSGKCLEKLSDNFTRFLIGSADLSPSNKTLTNNSIFNKNNYYGNYIHYGIREHAMCGIANGISTYNLIPVVATFLIFINYCLASIRLAALSKHQVIYVLTHDSVALGEDGPTHQPIESLTILRSIPNLLTLRPADGNETNMAYQIASQFQGPSCICLSRQNLIQLPNSEKLEDIKKGAYTLFQEGANQDLKLIVLATGSEVSACYQAIQELDLKNIRLISVLSTELFELQDKEYQENLLLKDVKKISFEAGSTLGWYKYADQCFGIDQFGKSADGDLVMDYFGLSKDKIKEKLMNYM